MMWEANGIRNAVASAIVCVSTIFVGAVPERAAQPFRLPSSSRSQGKRLSRTRDVTTGQSLDGSVPLNATWSQQAAISPTAPADFGRGVAVSGNTVLIGDDGTGIAYVYTRARGVWTQQAQLTAIGGADHFGYSVALSGTTALVGAYGTNGAYVFTRSGTTWSEQAALFPSDGAGGDQFGWSVALSADTNTVVVGAPAKNGNVGAAYVFTRSGTTWSQQQEITATGETGNGRFGYAVGVNGDRAVIGAPSDNHLTGAAFAFSRSGTTWSQQQVITATDGGPGAVFGQAVALDGATVAIGAGGAAGHLPAAVYLDVANGSSWTPQAELTSPLPYFGLSVALSGDTLVVGNLDGNNLAGAADVFVRRGSSWSGQAILTTPGTIQSDDFGFAVGVSGNAVIVGAPRKSNPAGTGLGAAYVFVRRSS